MFFVGSSIEQRSLSRLLWGLVYKYKSSTGSTQIYHTYFDSLHSHSFWWRRASKLNVMTEKKAIASKNQLWATSRGPFPRVMFVSCATSRGPFPRVMFVSWCTFLFWIAKKIILAWGDFALTWEFQFIVLFSRASSPSHPTVIDPPWIQWCLRIHSTTQPWEQRVEVWKVHLNKRFGRVPGTRIFDLAIDLSYPFPAVSMLMSLNATARMPCIITAAMCSPVSVACYNSGNHSV